MPCSIGCSRRATVCDALGDAARERHTRPGDQAGDRNPLHADPDFAKAAGFPAPILHGLCSYGIVLRTVTEDLLGGDATRVGGFTARFAGVVLPGETIRVRAWHEDDGIIVSATVAGEGERDGAPVLADCVLTPA